MFPSPPKQRLLAKSYLSPGTVKGIESFIRKINLIKTGSNLQSQRLRYIGIRQYYRKELMIFKQKFELEFSFISVCVCPRGINEKNILNTVLKLHS